MKFKNIVDIEKTLLNSNLIKNFHVFLEPVSYLNVHTLRDAYPSQIRQQTNNEEIGYVKFKMTVYLSKNKKEKNLTEYLSTLQNKEIIPTLSYFVYLPYYNKKLSCDNKNFSNLSVHGLRAMLLTYRQWNKKNEYEGFFSMPEISDSMLKKIELLSPKFLGGLLNEQRIGDVIENHLKQIIINPNFINFDISILPVEYNLDKFLWHEESINLIGVEDNKYKESSATLISIKQEFFEKVQLMFTPNIKTNIIELEKIKNGSK